VATEGGVTRWPPWVLLAAVLSAGAYLWSRHLLPSFDARAPPVLAPATDLTAKVAQLEADNGEMAAALERARAETPGARPVMVVESSTGRVTAGGEPRVPPAPPEPPAGAPVASAPAEACLVAAGDQLELGIREVIFDAGTVAGTIRAERAWPPPATQVALGQFELRVPMRAPPGWGLGAGAWGSSRGMAYGLAAAPPPMRVLGLDVELVLGVGWGPGGPQGSTIVLGRI
jgi:outer membrane murein-binding lipoprotein Lpp